MSMKPHFETEGIYTPDNLVVGGCPTFTQDETVELGQNLVRGAVVGKVDATGEVKLSVAGAIDGSEVPYGIMAIDVDATIAATVAPVYISGAFNRRQLTIGAGHTWESIRDGLRDRGIFLRETVHA